MLKSNLLCAFIALITAVTISSAFAKGYIINGGGSAIIEVLNK